MFLETGDWHPSGQPSSPFLFPGQCSDRPCASSPPPWEGACCSPQGSAPTPTLFLCFRPPQAGLGEAWPKSSPFVYLGFKFLL